MIHLFSRNKVRSCAAIATVLLFLGSSVVLGSAVSKAPLQNPFSRGTYVYTPTDDSYVGGMYDVNGNSPVMSLRNGSSGDQWLAAPTVKFDISGIPPESASLITSATLYIYYYEWHDSNPWGHSVTLRHFLGDWNEETLCRANMPAYSNTVTYTLTMPQNAGVWLAWNATTDVQNFVAGTYPNYGWIIRDEVYGGANLPLCYLHSKEYGNLIPYLEININDNNTNPDAPQISGPAQGVHGQMCNFTFVSTDPNSDQVSYMIDWGDGNTSGWLGPYDSGQAITLSKAWTLPGTYTIAAKARDVHGSESGWSTKDVTIINNAPLAPQITGPTQGVHGASYDFTVVTTDPDSDQVYYWVDWGDSHHTNWLGPYNSGQSATASHSWDAPGTYTVKAKSKDTIGDESGWGTTTIIVTNNPPGAPQVTGPVNGTTTRALNFTLVATDPDNDQLFYWVDWADGHTSDWLGPYPSGEFVVVEHSWKVPGTYDIKVKVKDLFDAQSNWTTYGIALVTNPPGAPWIVGVENGKVRQSYDFTFLSNDTDGDNVYYSIDWGDGQTTGWIGPYPSDQPLMQPHTFKKQGTYVVQAKAKDIYGAESAWGTLVVHMPLSYDNPGLLWSLLAKVFARFPHAFPVLRHLLGY